MGHQHCGHILRTGPLSPYKQKGTPQSSVKQRAVAGRDSGLVGSSMNIQDHESRLREFEGLLYLYLALCSCETTCND